MYKKTRNMISVLLLTALCVSLCLFISILTVSNMNRVSFRIYLIASLIYLTLSVALVIIILVRYVSKRKDLAAAGFSNEQSQKNSDEITQQMLLTQAQILSLQNQINPHFLYNTLESIRSKAVIRDEDDIAAMAEALAHLFRYNIGKGNATASISAEIKNVQDYLTIQNYRFRNKFQLILKTEEIENILDEYQLPILTLQPLVENSVHHGLENKLGTGKVYISAQLSQNNMILQVQDDGIGMEEATLDSIRSKLTDPFDATAPTKPENKHGNGIALINVNQRIKLLFGQEYGLELMSIQNVGTTINIVLPIPESNRNISIK